ncbi:hypothetical protein BDN71DRAFT_95717 [Pleurotus eryngii]|uniref:Uncharacterized protein n=1 Tax=Pleurotus eryngii TaxID=5323 RepID=A0A9P5ZR60_PLEER|nr:hypothetical protein BDN71DRAFT_95717 [Pleurotus eryngii]
MAAKNMRLRRELGPSRRRNTVALPFVTFGEGCVRGSITFGRPRLSCTTPLLLDRETSCQQQCTSKTKDWSPRHPPPLLLSPVRSKHPVQAVYLERTGRFRQYRQTTCLTDHCLSSGKHNGLEYLHLRYLQRSGD